MLDRLVVAGHEINGSHHIRIPTMPTAGLQYGHMPAAAPKSEVLHVRARLGHIPLKQNLRAHLDVPVLSSRGS